MARGDGTTFALRAREGGDPPSSVQLQVLRWLSHGLSLPEVAHQLGMNINTVKTHVRRLYARLEVGRAAHAVRVGFERGLLVANDDLRDLEVSVDERELDDEVDP